MFGSWDGLVDTEKLVEAARIIDVTWLLSAKAVFGEIVLDSCGHATLHIAFRVFLF